MGSSNTVLASLLFKVFMGVTTIWFHMDYSWNKMKDFDLRGLSLFYLIPYRVCEHLNFFYFVNFVCFSIFEDILEVFFSFAIPTMYIHCCIIKTVYRENSKFCSDAVFFKKVIAPHFYGRLFPSFGMIDFMGTVWNRVDLK